MRISPDPRLMDVSHGRRARVASADGPAFHDQPARDAGSWAVNNSCWKKRIAACSTKTPACERRPVFERSASRKQAPFGLRFAQSNLRHPNGMDMPARASPRSAVARRVALGATCCSISDGFIPRKACPIYCALALLRKRRSIQTGTGSGHRGWSQNGHEQELKISRGNSESPAASTSRAAIRRRENGRLSSCGCLHPAVRQ